jgi:tRNA modification GTPase
LDFSEEDLHFVSQVDLLNRLAKGLAQLTLLRKQFEQRAVVNKGFRVVLAGRPNAGKSSLFNALIQDAKALVSPEPGTTRDYLMGRLELDGVVIELIDTAGKQTSNGTIETQAQALGAEQVAQADLVLLCLEAGKPVTEEENELLAPKRRPKTVAIATKCDLHAAAPGLVATSTVTGHGLEKLRSLLAKHAQARKQPALAPSLSRCRHHVEDCLKHLRQAHDIVLNEDPSELLALELRGALDGLGEMVGAIYTDDLLDRIFSRFCIGK